MKRKAFRIIWIVLGILLVICGRVLYESRYEFQKGIQEKNNQKIEEAVTHWGHSIQWYFPGNPYVSRSIHELWKVGQERETSEATQSLLAYDILRGSLYSIRSFYWPYQEWILRVNDRIAHLRAQQQVQWTPKTSFAEALAFHQARLQNPSRPKSVWVMVTEVGFLGWIGFVFLWIWKGFDSEGRMYGKKSLPWVMGMVLFFFFWILGLIHA